MTVNAIAQVFSDGLSDPRGCDYREIEVVTGQQSRNPGGVKTHGWIFPGQGDQKFAVCWNGVVYPVVSVGEPADLEQDFAQMLKSDAEEVAKEQAHWDAVEEGRKKSAEQSGQTYTHVNWGHRWDELRQEDMMISWDHLHPIKAVLLLRLGKADLAEKAWNQWYDSFSGQPPDDPYLPLVDDWAYSLFARAAWAHFYGDDHLSFASVQALVPLQQAGKADAAAKKLVAGYSSMPQPYLRFLEQVPALVADEQRRVDEPARIPILQMEHQPQGQDLVVGLIHDLELVNELPDSSPGAVNPMNSPIVQALVNQGDAAMEPLLSCYENDDRLTRSLDIDFGKPGRQIGFIDVRWMAYVALCNILHTVNFGDPSRPNLSPVDARHDASERIRAYWQRIKGKSRADVSYDTLNDDHASPAQWLDAAIYLVQKTNVTSSPGTGLYYGSWSSRWLAPGEVPQMRGEPLRAITNPSVSDLLIKRYKRRLDAQADDAYDYALILADWDGKAHLDILHEATSKIPDRSGGNARLVDLFEKRVDLGDHDAEMEYANWVTQCQPSVDPFGSAKMLQLIWRHPESQVLANAAKQIFSDPKLGWINADGTEFAPPHPLGYSNSALIGAPAYREVVYRALESRTKYGTVTMQADGKFCAPWGGRIVDYKNDPLAPSAGTTVEFRTCDAFAYQLSYLPGAPKCFLYWPESKRDEGVRACIKYLHQYGDDLRSDNKDASSPFSPDADSAQFHIPLLDHPATSEDVEAGRAIFSLSGSRRVVSMPLPVSATWSSRPDQPAGNIWQVEEELVDGKWQRFYGLVGEMLMAKVPASEIEFQRARWKIGPGFDARLSMGAEPDFTHMADLFTHQVALGAPIPISFTIRNIKGVEQQVPEGYLPPTEDGKTLPSAVTITLFYTNKVQPNDQLWSSQQPKIQPSTHPASAQSKIIGPGDELTTTRIDLRDFFDLSQPGTYRFHATSNSSNLGDRESDDVSFTIVKS